MNNLIKNEFKEDLLYGGEYISAGTCEFYQALIGFGAGGTATASYVIRNSLRFNDNDSAYLRWTPDGAGDDGLAWTLSFWVKRSNITLAQRIVSSQIASGHQQFIDYIADDTFRYYAEHSPTAPDTDTNWTTKAKYRDPSAWMHVIIVWDSANGTADDRLRLYNNGVRVLPGDITKNAILQNVSTEGLFHTAVATDIGRLYSGSTYFDGYLAEFVRLDGIAWDETDGTLGEYDSNKNWVPIDPSELTFGTNGFYLNFAIAPGTGNGAGEDVSGNGNHFTESGLAANDQVTDSPTDDADNDIGNYATFNPLILPTTYSNGNLTAATTGNKGTGISTIAITPDDTGKYAAEFTVGDVGTASLIGICTDELVGTDSSGYSYFRGSIGNQYSQNNLNGTISYANDGTIVSLGATDSSAPATYTTGDVIRVEVDRAADTIQFFKGGAAQVTIGSLSDRTAFGGNYFFCVGGIANTISANFGQQGFAGTPTSGFVGLNTANLPAPALIDSTKHFQVDTFTGTAEELVRTLTDRGDAAFAPDLIWGTNRTTTGAVHMVDSVRGATKEIESDDYSDEATAAQGVKSLNASGYTLGTDADYNAESANVNWCFKFGGAPTADNSAGAAATPTANSVKVNGSNHGSATTGSIPVLRGSANTTAAMSAIKFTGTGANGTIDHFLGVVPEFILVKTLANGSGGNSWRCYHAGAASDAQTDALQLNGLIAAADDSIFWNDTAPTSALFSVGSSSEVHTDGNPSIAYCFANVENYSKIGAFEGNGNVNGAFVHCGFRPTFILVKSADSTSEWDVYDSKRDGYNPDNDALSISTPLAETTANDIDILSNGFKCRIATDPNVAETYVYMAIAEHPFGGSGVSQARAR